MSKPLRVGLTTFRMLSGPFSGTICVVQRVSRRRGARKANRHKETQSRASLAGPGDGSGPTDGGSAITSDARSSDRMTDAGSADGQGDDPKRALIPGKEQWAPAMEYPVSQIQAIKALCGTRWDFVNEVNAGVEMSAVARKLLGDEDSKVQLRMLERLLDILDSVEWKDPRLAEQHGSLAGRLDMPRPERD